MSTDDTPTPPAPALPQEVRNDVAEALGVFFEKPEDAQHAEERVLGAVARHWPRQAPVTADARELADKIQRLLMASPFGIRADVNTDAIAAVLAPVVDALATARKVRDAALRRIARAEAAERERDDLAAKNRQVTREWSEQVAALRAQLAAAQTTLQLIVDKWDCCSELFTSDSEAAQNLADTARKALDAARREGGGHD